MIIVGAIIGWFLSFFLCAVIETSSDTLLIMEWIGVIVGAVCGGYFKIRIFTNRQKKEKAEEEAERKRKAAEKEAAVEREMANLINKGMVKAVSEEIEIRFQNSVKSQINNHINYYGHKPSAASVIRYPDSFRINSKEIWLDDLQGVDGEVCYQKLGYHDLKDEIQCYALARALAKSFPYLWTCNGTNTIYPYTRHWDTYVRRQIDAICSEKGISALK